MANLLKPNKLREHFIDYIKKYFIAGTEIALDEIDTSILKQMDNEFKGFGSIIISMSNYHFNLCAIMILSNFVEEGSNIRAVLIATSDRKRGW